MWMRLILRHSLFINEDCRIMLIRNQQTEMFQQTLEFLLRNKFMYVHIFIYP